MLKVEGWGRFSPLPSYPIQERQNAPPIGSATRQDVAWARCYVCTRAPGKGLPREIAPIRIGEHVPGVERLSHATARARPGAATRSAAREPGCSTDRSTYRETLPAGFAACQRRATD